MAVRARRATIDSVDSHEGHRDDEAVLDNLSQPVELNHLETMASGALHLNHDWIAYLDEAHLPTQVAGVDDAIHHGAPEGGTAYA